MQVSQQMKQKRHHHKQRKGQRRCPGGRIAWTDLGAERWEAPQDKKARCKLGWVLEVFLRLLGFTLGKFLGIH